YLLGHYAPAESLPFCLGFKQLLAGDMVKTYRILCRLIADSCVKRIYALDNVIHHSFTFFSASCIRCLFNTLAGNCEASFSANMSALRISLTASTILLLSNESSSLSKGVITFCIAVF